MERVGVRRRLLRAGRPLAAGDAGGLAGARGVRRRAAAARRSSRRRRWRRWRARSRRVRARPDAAAPPAIAPRGRPRAAALVRAAAAVVPRPAGAGQHGLQHPARRCGCTGALDVAALRARAGRSSCARHEALRTTFAHGRRRAGAGDRAARRAVPLPVIDLSALPADARGGRCADRRARRRARPFDLARGPLLRGRAAAAGGRTSTCCCSPCTTSSRDGWSMGVLRRASWRRSTRAFAPGERVAAAGAAGPVRRLRGLAARVAAGRGAGARSWPTGSEQLAGAPALLELPTDRPRAARRRPSRARSVELRAGRGADGAAAGAEPARGRDAVHDAAGGFQALLARYSGPGRHRRRHADRRTAARRSSRG